MASVIDVLPRAARARLSRIRLRRRHHTICDAVGQTKSLISTATRLYFRMGFGGLWPPKNPIRWGCEGGFAALAPPPWMESGGLCPPDLLTLVVLLEADASCCC